MKKINLQRDIDSRNAICEQKNINTQPIAVVEINETTESTEANEEVQADKATKKSGKRKASGDEEASAV